MYTLPASAGQAEIRRRISGLSAAKTGNSNHILNGMTQCPDNMIPGQHDTDKVKQKISDSRNLVRDALYSYFSLST